jgi:hypothetical protein
MLTITTNSRISWPAFADAGYSTLRGPSVPLGSSEARTLPKTNEERKGISASWLKLIQDEKCKTGS